MLISVPFRQKGSKRRVYVIALIDDASRFILGADVERWFPYTDPPSQ